MVLDKVRDWGNFIIEKKDLELVDIIGQKSKLDGVEKVIKVVLKKNNGDISYKDTKVEDYNPDQFRRYLYRTFRHGQYDVTPTAKPSSANKMKRRWGQWFGTYARKKNDFWDDDFVRKIHDEILEPSEDGESYKKELREEILSDIKEIDKTLEEDSIYTITIEENTGEKYLGDLETFKDIFTNESVKKFHEKLKVDARGQGNCSLCGKETEVFGFASPFSIFTLKPKGFASELERKNAWKQLPVCKECGIICIKGREFLDTYLKNELLGYSWRGDYVRYTYYVIPSVTYSENGIKRTMGEIYDEIESYEDEDYEHGLLSEEDPTYGLLGEKDNVNLTFVFSKEKQKDFFDVIKLIQNVPPSWIYTVYDQFEKIDERNFFSEDNLQTLIGKKWAGSLRNGAWDGNKQNHHLKGILRYFFPASENTGKHDKDFISVLGNILSNIKFSKNILIDSFIREIRSKHVNEEGFSEKLLCLRSLYLFEYVNSLGLLKGVKNMEDENEIEKKSDKYRRKVNEFFDEFSNALNTNAKKAVFLEGVLTRFLLDIQSQERGSTPFRSKLRGLRLDELKIKNLFPDITEKLRQYDAPYYQWLEEMISQYFIAADDEGWDISKNEVSYYFALGLNLGRSFKIKEEKEGEKNE